MADQNKTVTIAAIAVLAIAVIGVSSYFFFADSSPPPQPVVNPTPQPVAEPAAKPEKKTPRKPRKDRAEDKSEEPKVIHGSRGKRHEEMTPEERKKRRGPTNLPRGPAP